MLVSDVHVAGSLALLIALAGVIVITTMGWVIGFGMRRHGLRVTYALTAVASCPPALFAVLLITNSTPCDVTPAANCVDEHVLGLEVAGLLGLSVIQWVWVLTVASFARVMPNGRWLP